MYGAGVREYSDPHGRDDATPRNLTTMIPRRMSWSGRGNASDTVPNVREDLDATG